MFNSRWWERLDEPCVWRLSKELRHGLVYLRALPSRLLPNLRVHPAAKSAVARGARELFWTWTASRARKEGTGTGMRATRLV